MAVQFVPASDGGWLTFVEGPRALAVAGSVVSGPVATQFVEAAWAAIRKPDGFQSALELLTAKGLAATPEFVLVEWERGGDARTIVRGAATVRVTDAAGEQPLAASGVSTWVERTLPGVTSLTLAVPGATPTGVPLPLDSGVALVASLEFGAAPRPVVAPVDADPEATISGVPEADGTTVSDPEQPGDDTVHRPPRAARMALAASSGAPSAVTPPETPAAGDHDGRTVLVSDVAKLRGSRRTTRGSAPLPPPASPELVLVLSTTGAREPLNQPILVGRSPSVSKVSGASMPRLVTVGGIDQDISRNHVQFAVEGGTVVVTDLHSKNGTSIVLPGKDPQKLRAGEPTTVLVGTVVDLGGGLTFTIEEEPIVGGAR